MFTRGLFITGTDTAVGKTHVAALIARTLRSAGRSVGVYKPVATGSIRDDEGREVWEDIERLSAAVDGEFPGKRICPQRFGPALAPPVSAVRTGRSVDADLLRLGAGWWEGRVELLLIEGVGGLLCPLTETETVADLAGDLGYPLLIVARLELGTINHTLLTVEAARRRNLPIAGIVLNETIPANDDPAGETNPAEIARRCDPPLLGVIRYETGAGLPQEGSANTIDWMGLFGPT